MSDGPRKCRYCPGGPPLVPICLGCQTRLEEAERKLKVALRDRDFWKRNYFRVLDDKRKLGKGKTWTRGKR